MGTKVVVWAALLLSGCLQMQSIDCGEFTCPRDTACAVELHQCVTPEQASACESIGNGMPCTANGTPGICTQTYCIAGCGDSIEGRNEECDDGNFASHDGCSSRCLIESLAWLQVEDPWTPIASPAVAYLAANGGTLVRFGGYGPAGSTNLLWQRTNDVWTQITEGLPPPRHYMAYGHDVTRDRLVIFGGTTNTSQALDETWEYDGTTWTRIMTTVQPPKRWGAAMAYDEVRHVFVLFGGFNPYAVAPASSLLRDTWEYNPTTQTWAEVTLTTNPQARFWHSMTWDAVAQRVVMFGGIGGTQQAWKYDGTNRWVAITGVGPTNRPSTALAYSPDTERVVLFGGRGAGVYDVTADTWELDTVAGTWTQLGVSLSPPGRYEHGMVYDAGRGTIAVFGGFTGSAIHEDAWELVGDRWKDVTPRYAPHNPSTVAIAYDRARRRTLALDWDRQNNASRSDLWEFDGTTWMKRPLADRPRRATYTVAYDAVAERTVFFGGLDSTNAVTQTTWEWDGTAWSEPVLSASPPARYFGSMTQATPNGGVLLHGGLLGTSLTAAMTNDTWLYDGTSWREIATPTEIPAETAPMLAYDGAMERVVLLTESGATWQLQNEVWTQLGQHPAPRAQGALVYRADRKRLLLYGGRGAADVWELDGSTWQQLELIGTRPPPRVFAGAAYHESARSLVLFGGGIEGAGTLEDTWLLGYGSLTIDEVCGNDVDDDGDYHDDATDPDCAF